MIDLYHRRIVLAGLIGVIWFSALARGAHDLWSASVVFLMLSLLAVFFCAARLRSREALRFPVIGLALALLLTTLLSICNRFDADAWQLESWGWFFMLVAAYLLVNSVSEEGLGEAFFLPAGAIVFILAIICVWQQVTGHPWNYDVFVLHLAHWTIPIRYGHWEIHATLINSNILVGFILYWPIFFWQQRRKDRRMWVLLTACVVILVLARSWSGVVAAMFEFLLYYQRRLREEARRRPLGVCALFLAMTVVMAGILWVKTHQPVSGHSYSMSDRWYYWLIALRIWKHSPWTGVGVGGYPSAFLFFKAQTVENTLFAHNFYLGRLAETGLVGMAGMMAFLIQAFVISVRLAERPENPDPRFLATLGAVYAYSVININMEYFLNQLMLVITVLAAAFTYSASSKGVPVRRLWVGSFALCLILVIPFWLSPLVASRRFITGTMLEEHGEISAAEACYQSAIMIDRSNADSYAALGRLAWNRYLDGRANQDRYSAIAWMAQAVRFRRNIENVRHYGLYTSAPVRPVAQQ